jgi:uncharacterized protein (DUF2147 family)
MRRIFLAATLALAATPALAADPVEGEWFTMGASAKVKIAPCAGNPERMCGLITWLKSPNNKAGQPLRDTSNPDPALRDRPVLGMAMIRDFKPRSAGRWTGGKIYDPGRGKSYDSKLTINPDGTLKVEGCVAVICQAQTWRKAS